MTAPADRPYRFHLTQRHVLVLCILAGLGLGSLALAGRGRRWFADELPTDTDRMQQTCERVDPNIADQASLRRLPNIGPTRAQAILQYRQQHGPGCFTDAADLMNVPGIGLGTARLIAPHLTLPNHLP
jgi:competence ComEA-like helix-hairpin-helix protein